jgi:hypothetical protein
MKREKERESKGSKCDQYCSNVFLPERERVEVLFTRKAGLPPYVPVDKMSNKVLGSMMKDAYIKTCNGIYCSPKCGFVETIDSSRRKNLTRRGALSACRDLVREFPGYYDARKV